MSSTRIVDPLAEDPALPSSTSAGGGEVAPKHTPPDNGGGRRYNARRGTHGGELTFTAWHELWPDRVRRDPRTIHTHTHRINRYILPHLPQHGDIPLRDITRASLHDVQIALLEEGLSKGTIDGALSSTSAVLGYALDERRIEFNPAQRMRVDPDDPLLDPIREQLERRYIPPHELAELLKYVKTRHRAVCLAPLATGCRTQELLGLEGEDHDPKQQLILVHQRAGVLGGDPDKEGVLRPGLKTTKGIRRKTKQQRGRLTLYPTILLGIAPQRLHRLIFPSPTGRVWGQRNFYRDVWEPASKAAGTNFTVHDLRHTFTSHLLAAGIPAVEVAAYAGHSTRSLGELDNNTTTRIYQHPTGEHRQAALDAINTYINDLKIDTQTRR